jgi:hypothetical protein
LTGLRLVKVVRGSLKGEEEITSVLLPLSEKVSIIDGYGRLTIRDRKNISNRLY